MTNGEVRPTRPSPYWRHASPPRRTTTPKFDLTPEQTTNRIGQHLLRTLVQSLPSGTEPARSRSSCPPTHRRRRQVSACRSLGTPEPEPSIRTRAPLRLQAGMPVKQVLEGDRLLPKVIGLGRNGQQSVMAAVKRRSESPSFKAKTREEEFDRIPELVTGAATARSREEEFEKIPSKVSSMHQDVKDADNESGENSKPETLEDSKPETLVNSKPETQENSQLHSLDNLNKSSQEVSNSKIEEDQAAKEPDQQQPECAANSKIIPCFRGEYPTRHRPGSYQWFKSAVPNCGNIVTICDEEQQIMGKAEIVTACEVTEAHFLSIDCEEDNMPAIPRCNKCNGCPQQNRHANRFGSSVRRQQNCFQQPCFQQQQPCFQQQQPCFQQQQPCFQQQQPCFQQQQPCFQQQQPCFQQQQPCFQQQQPNFHEQQTQIQQQQPSLQQQQPGFRQQQPCFQQQQRNCGRNSLCPNAPAKQRSCLKCQDQNQSINSFAYNPNQSVQQAILPQLQQPIQQRNPPEQVQPTMQMQPVVQQQPIEENNYCLTEMLAEELKKQMLEAQAQIAQVQLQLNSACGATRVRQMHVLTQNASDAPGWAPETQFLGSFTEEQDTGVAIPDEMGQNGGEEDPMSCQEFSLQSADQQPSFPCQVSGSTKSNAIWSQHSASQNSQDPMQFGLYPVPVAMPNPNTYFEPDPQQFPCQQQQPASFLPQQMVPCQQIQQQMVPCPQIQQQYRAPPLPPLKPPPCHQKQQQQRLSCQQQQQQQPMRSGQPSQSNKCSCAPQFCPSCCCQRYAQMRFMMPRCWPR
ncbi:PAX-interacting protein 1 [Drosophila suzukii]|uniref:PAX-interacting protein 1 n=1 Tax=Drosophila suzukii TaxID=28584 RepID=A0AB40DA99_DROSZ